MVLAKKNRDVDQWDQIKVPDINPQTDEKLIFETELKLSNGRKKEIILNKWCWHNWMSTCRRMKIQPCLHHAKTQVKMD